MKNNTKNILKKEIREMFRDKKSLAMMLIIPFLIPFIIIGMSALLNQNETDLTKKYNKIGFAYNITPVENEIINELGISAFYDSEEALKEKYEKGEIDVYITKNKNTYIINQTSSENSAYASALAESYFNTYKEYLQKTYLEKHQINSNDVMNIITLNKKVSQKDNFYKKYITIFSFMFIIMAITVSATYPATDTTAGEKERGTLETLLTFPVKSKDIIIVKFLAVSISSIITGIISLILMILSLYIVSNTFTIFKEDNIMLSIGSFIYILLVIISYSFTISGLCIAIASKCKTFKEAQSALTPLTFISFFPGMIAYMVNVKTTALLSLIPFLNTTLLFTDITNNQINYLNIILMFVSTIILIVIVLYVIIKQYKNEKVLFTN